MSVCEDCAQLARELGTEVGWTCWMFWCDNCPTVTCAGIPRETLTQA